jgi:hypothetical protein
MNGDVDILIVGVSSAFADERTLREKLGNYLASIENYRVLALNDSRGIVRSYFGGTLFDSLMPSMSLAEKRKLVRSAKWAVYFWDGTGISDFVYLSSLYGLRTKVIPVPTTRVVNKDRGDEFDVYIGRGTPWGNPFSIGDRGADRAAVIDMYREYFQKRFVEDPAGRKDIQSLRGKVLGCHCKPSACHGDVIVEYLNSLDDET